MIKHHKGIRERREKGGNIYEENRDEGIERDIVVKSFIL